ncbi:hypothetical protein CHLRE_02g108000v5 [Chlamydomonas reinhardtii]|uniref:non-specific serine/threonine protein kinase n=1 Tax=Chlamydomonas reinhardtii TaxID=3055 RepID=A0A2K3E2R9_CHLRE|nr:uncharacterized protein CHLRE_02g108000v5 [Chlamydomonas reinhardtii]PNW87078.1 hypothetical protein CHLRE_02g108000v5 [Chlamydomonas reinhardtii]
MLQDATNTREGAGVKVFARRKPAAPTQRDAGDADSSACARGAGRNTSCRASDASDVSAVAPLPGPAEWRRRLDSRRTSVLKPPLPADGGNSLLHKADWLAQRHMPARQRESRNAAVAAVLSEMRAHYDEVDQEELVVESPDASPLKGAGGGSSRLAGKLAALALLQPKHTRSQPTEAIKSPDAAKLGGVLASGRASPPTPAALSSRTEDTTPVPSTAAEEDSAASTDAVVQLKAKPADAGCPGSPASGACGVACAEWQGAASLEDALQEARSPGRRSGVPGATADLSSLQRLLLLCGQEPHLPLEALPSMDDLIGQLAQQLAGGQLGAANGAAAASATGGAAAGPVGSAHAASSAGGRATRATRQAKRGAADAAGAIAGGADNARAVEPSATAKRPVVVKVGEGSYGEAWRLGGGKAAGQGGAAAPAVVIKVVPIDGKEDFNGGPQKTAADMQSETLMCRELSALGAAGAPGASEHFTSGFVRTHAVAVCRGPYSSDLVKAWEKWDAEHGSENEPVSELPPDQLYWCIAMEDSGTDLEKYDKLESWDQLRSVLLQVAVSLAVSEAALAFEHRDLHWGNVLIRPHAPPDGSAGCMTSRLRGHTLKVSSCGLVATIIDFTNSRLQAADGTLAFCDLEADPAVFEGTRGDVQFDTYRWMRSAVERDWSASCPETNCLWLGYLAEVLATKFGAGGGGGSKAGAGGKKGAAALGLKLSVAQKRELREFRKRAVACSSCGDLILDTLFGGLLQLEQ